jgi:hypothetical protein
MGRGWARPWQPPRSTPYDANGLAFITQAITTAYQDSFAASSRGNMNSAARLYATFCQLAGLPAFPVSAHSLMAYCVDYVHRGNTPASLDSIISRLKAYSVEAGHAWLPYSQWVHVRKVKRGLARAFKEAPKRAAAFTLRVLGKVLDAVDATAPQEVMVATMCAVAHNGLLRGGELLKLTVGDLVWRDQTRTRCFIRLVESKTNQFGPPEEIPYQAPLFPSDPLDPGSPPISRDAFVAVMRTLLARAGLPGAAYTGHSFRSGGATDLFHGKCRLHTIKLQGRWLSEAIYIYVRDCPVSREKEVGQAFRRAARRR